MSTITAPSSVSQIKELGAGLEESPREPGTPFVYNLENTAREQRCKNVFGAQRPFPSYLPRAFWVFSNWRVEKYPESPRDEFGLFLATVFQNIRFQAPIS